jgi:phospholipase A1
MSPGIQSAHHDALLMSVVLVCRRWSSSIARCVKSWLLAALCLLAAPGVGADTLDPACVVRLAETADDSMTVAEIREACGTFEARPDGEASVPDDPAPEDGEAVSGLVERRLAAEREEAARRFSIMAHKPNYFLAAAYNTEGWNSAESLQEDNGGPYANKDLESQFQISLKVPLAVGLFGDRVDVYGAYTNRSFWQVYDRENSEPFRETNHEPEMWLQFSNDWEILGFTNSVNTVGWVHQSNGRSGLSSRSWDRIYATIVFERSHWALVFKPWLWVSPDKDDGDNPDIDRYLGNGEFRLIYGRKGHVFSTMLRNQLESGFDRGAFELSWSFPVFDYPYLRGYVQYFYGYGESLIDYNNKVNRLGIGISVTDFLD